MMLLVSVGIKKWALSGEEQSLLEKQEGEAIQEARARGEGAVQVEASAGESVETCVTDSCGENTELLGSHGLVGQCLTLSPSTPAPTARPLKAPILRRV